MGVKRVESDNMGQICLINFNYETKTVACKAQEWSAMGVTTMPCLKQCIKCVRISGNRLFIALGLDNL